MRYFFDLTDGDGGYTDRLGVDLLDNAAAERHGQSVASDLIRNREKTARHWGIQVRDEGGLTIAVIRLLSHDDTLKHLSDRSRRTMEEISRRRYALSQVMDAARITRRKSLSLVARSRGKPHLVSVQGDPV